MTPFHHPSEATLLVYAAGGLGEGMALVVAGHLGYCGTCRSIIAAAEAVGGALLEEIAPEEVSAETRRRVVARLDRDSLPERAIPSLHDQPAGLPLEEFLARRKSGGRWGWLSPGVRHLPVSSELQLVKAAPGRSLPIHGHTGSELTLVLEGCYCDEFGCYRLGDVAEVDEEISHRPVAHPGEGCLCLLASEGPFKPAGWIARVLYRWPGLVSSRSG
jgi:putative transcriptional regulator